MAQAENYNNIDDAGILRDLLRHRDQARAELRSELDEANDILRRFDEYVEDYNGTLESWRQTFDMVMTDDGAWTWDPFWDKHNQLIDQYNDLVKRWNRNLTAFNDNQRDVGRPLAASEAQVAEVIELHDWHYSLREIVDQTSLGLQTVRTIVGRHHGRDRTSKKRRANAEKIEINKFERAHWKTQKRTGDALPKRVQAVIETGQALVTEAKGLGRRR